MVVFTCNHCGETLHKPKVEKHYQFVCRNYKSVTCVDCFKDFRDEEYVIHTKCITEDERYAAKGTYKNGIVKKGDVKQESWLEMIKSICNIEQNLKPSLKNLLNTISAYSNVPRKKQKFMNFIKSSSGNRVNLKEVEEVWDIIEKYKASNNPNIKKNADNKKEEIPVEQNDLTDSKQHKNKKRSVENDHTEEENLKKKKKKSMDEAIQKSVIDPDKNGKLKLEPFKGTEQIFIKENGTTEQNEKSKKKNKQQNIEHIESTETPKFNFKNEILQVLNEKHNISHKKLQKKILKAYISATGETDCEEKVVKKFNKKLKKIPNVGLEDDRVVMQG